MAFGKRKSLSFTDGDLQLLSTCATPQHQDRRWSLDVSRQESKVELKTYSYNAISTELKSPRN